MDKKKQKALEANGWVVGSVSELLGLSAEETLLMELHADLAQAIRALRAKLHISQQHLAARMGSTQAKVSDAEHGVGSMDFMLRALVAMGAQRREIMTLVGKTPSKREQRSDVSAHAARKRAR